MQNTYVHVQRGKLSYVVCLSVWVPRRQPHYRSGLATLSSVGAVP